MQNDNPVDIECIMADIRREIEEKGLRDTFLPFEEVNAAPSLAVGEYDPLQFSWLVGVMDHQKHVKAYRVLQSHHKLMGKPIIFVKKAIRKLAKFYIEPIVEDQNTFNASVAQGMQSIHAFMHRPDDQRALLLAIRELRAENIELKKRISRLESRAHQEKE